MEDGQLLAVKPERRLISKRRKILVVRTASIFPLPSTGEPHFTAGAGQRLHYCPSVVTSRAPYGSLTSAREVPGGRGTRRRPGGRRPWCDQAPQPRCLDKRGRKYLTSRVT